MEQFLTTQAEETRHNSTAPLIKFAEADLGAMTRIGGTNMIVLAEVKTKSITREYATSQMMLPLMLINSIAMLLMKSIVTVQSTPTAHL